MGKGALSIVSCALVLVACASKPSAVVPKAPASAAPAAAAGADDATDDADADGDDAPDEAAAPSREAGEGPCDDDMALVEVTGADGARMRYCIDKYEASLVETMPDGSERPYPHYAVVDGHDVRAVSKAGVFPQGFISEVQARDACAASNKHLCTYEEWKVACMGPQKTTFPYGDARRAGVCHDAGKSAVGAVFGAKALAASTPPPAAKPPSSHVVKGGVTSTTRPRGHAAHAKGVDARGKVAKRGAPPSGKAADSKSDPRKKGSSRRTGKKSTRPASVDLSVWTKLNDPALGQVEGALSKTGDHASCVNDFGVFDMVGNLHEWVATDPSTPHGTFAGGYYLDTSQNGDGCNYRTVAHAHDYHDYSTGFRCCAAAR